MRITLRKKRWELVFKSLKNADCWGFCEQPEKPGKKIVIDKSIVGEKRIEILIHEMIHATNWTIDEECVADSARDIARILWKLGYRGPEDGIENKA